MRRRHWPDRAILPRSGRRRYAAFPRKRCCHAAAWGVVGEPRQPVARVPPGQQGYRALLPGGYVDAVKVRPREAADQAAAEAFLARHNSLRGARLGELVHPMDHPAFVAETAGGRLAGMLTYVPGQDWQQCEILTLHADQQWRGAGTALIEAAAQLARRQGCTRLWVITTNDNVDALRFYQRRGFCLVRAHRGAVDRSRACLKPEIPPVGAYGIPLRDEIELERQP
jgi:GNAT superfamily N-acetyltransferase